MYHLYVLSKRRDVQLLATMRNISEDGNQLR